MRSFAIFAASNDRNPVILRREDAEGSQNTRLEILRRLAALAAQDGVVLFQRVEIRGDVATVGRGDAEVRHRALGIERRRVLQPLDHRLRIVRELAGEVGARGHVIERRANHSFRPGHAWNVVAGGAAIALDCFFSARGIASLLAITTNEEKEEERAARK